MATKKETDSHSEAPAASSPRPRDGSRSAPVPSTETRWGKVRDALAALGNLETVLRGGVALSLGDDVVPELRQGIEWLRDAFRLASAPRSGDAARGEAMRALEQYAGVRLDGLEAALDRLPDAPADELIETVSRLSGELDAAAGLLDLAERSLEPSPVDLSVGTLAEQSLQVAWTIRAHGATRVRVRPVTADCSVQCDPHIATRLLAIAVSIVREHAAEVVVGTRIEHEEAIIEVLPASEQEPDGADVQTKLIRHIEPTEAIARAAARAAGIELHVEPRRAELRLRRGP